MNYQEGLEPEAQYPLGAALDTLRGFRTLAHLQGASHRNPMLELDNAENLSAMNWPANNCTAARMAG